MKAHAPAHAARLVDVRPVVERRLVAREHRLHQRAELEVERNVVVLVPEPEPASVLEALQRHPAHHVAKGDQPRARRLAAAECEELPRQPGPPLD